ncbi:MAG TPA: hypothetical protein VD837_08060 [Terriglobales bacterium]|nr:hypothetical protein [Terriglobales bacterium]
MDSLEQELRNALRREPTPDGFMERVLARVRHEETARESSWAAMFAFMRRPAFRVAATAAVFLVMLGGLTEYRSHQQEKQAGEAAKRQLMLALRITGSKLQYAQQKVEAVESRQYYGIVKEGSERLQ